MHKPILVSVAAALSLTAVPVQAQDQTARDRIASIFGALFGDRLGATTSIEAQWSAGQTPLANQRSQFDARVDTEVRSGALTQTAGARLKSDYAALVQLETRYGSDRRFTQQEQADLVSRYNALTQVLTSGGYAEAGVAPTALAANGRAEFDRRVDAAVSARRLTRTQGTRLKADYGAVVQLESTYLRDGVITDFERNDLDTRLDALDQRVGDTAAPAAALTSRQRLDRVLQALPSSGLRAAAQTQLRVEHGDLLRLEAAYARLTPTAEERAYLESRIADLETRANVRR